MTRFLVAALLAVCVSYASAAASWGPWKIRDHCPCGSSARKVEIWKRECFGGVTYCPRSYEEQARPCQCQVLTPGEMAGVVVGCVVFLILVIILVVWCCVCGGCCQCDDDCDCMNCMGCGCMRMSRHGRYDSEDDLYRGKVVRAPMQHVQQHQPQQVYVTAAPQPQMQVRAAPINFSGSVVVQGQPQATSYFVG